MKTFSCRFCQNPLELPFLDLGPMPRVNAFIGRNELSGQENFYPLTAFFCGSCSLVQLGESLTPEKMFRNYPYFSSLSSSYLRHAREFSEEIARDLKLGSNSQVIEIASNDGYLLKNFIAMGIPSLGIEPAENVAQKAVAEGVFTLNKFFSLETAQQLAGEGKKADLIVANNVLAHVPDLNDFLAGLQLLLKPEGTLTLEFPHLLKILEDIQFDTIHHEHFSYLSLGFVEKACKKFGLEIYEAREIPTHGGSLRIYIRHADTGKNALHLSLEAIKRSEREVGLERMETYRGFEGRVQKAKNQILEFLQEAKREGKKVVGYGAPAKGVILLNHCGVERDLLDCTVDVSPHKQGYFMPGTHQEILPVTELEVLKPDFVFLLAWNLRSEIIENIKSVRNWGGKFVIPLPQVEIVR